MNENFQQIHQLFEQLRQSLIKTSTHSPESILNNLANTCSNLIKLEWLTPIDTLDMFEYMLKNCLELLDMTQFIDIIVQYYTTSCLNFFHKISASFNKICEFNLIDNMTCKARQQMYYRLLDQLSASTRMACFLKNDLSFESTEIDHLQRTITNFCGSLLIIILRYLVLLHGRWINIELDKYQNTIFIPFMTFLDKCFTINKHLHNKILVTEILIFLLRTSSKTQTIPIFIHINYIQACLRWSSLPYLTGYDYLYILGILYNIARHDDGLMLLSSGEYDKILYQFRPEIANTMIIFILYHDTLRTFYLNYFMMMILCFNKFDNYDINTFVTDYLIPTILNASMSSTNEDLNFHLSELWIIIMKLCTWNNYIDHILQNNEFPTFFADILSSCLYYTENTQLDDISNRVTVMALINILWNISFHDRYKIVLIEHTELIKRLELIRSTDTVDKVVHNIYIPRYIPSLRRAIDGLWHNLYPLSLVKSNNLTSISNKLVHSLVISYSQVDITFCRQIYDIFNKLPQLSISVDFNNGKYLWKEIAETIEQSHLILFLISKDFYNSPACRQEFFYAIYTLKKKFIPVFINTDYQASSWLRSPLTRSKHIRFGNEDFMHTCDELLSMINEYLSIKIPPISTPKSLSDAKQWNNQDVQQWFIRNNILSELYDFYQFQNGNELLLYGQAISSSTWINEYGRIKLRFEEKYKQKNQQLSSYDFSNFISALERLKNKNISSI
ncbi:unnamed protein product [Adineta steineri]|uniref:TIR domain-containing protein n=1 Tax=Adineta steineri TaxID=433720 RepID=A0A813ZRK3_9BILA|nr:unnamed protein product [Adineta steineri]CAF1402800.1 unnamed protein product [Adineta steineri]